MTALPHLGPLLREQGVDLCAAERPAALERGTPVFVYADADPVDVQRRMAQAHVRMLFVLNDDEVVIGIVDIWELARRAETLPWSAPQTTSASA
jgi:CBS domain-containing protein